MPAVVVGGRVVILRVVVHGAEVKRWAIVGQENLDDFSPAFRVIAENLRRFERRVFNEEGVPSIGRPWEPLRPRTVEARRRGWGHYAKPSNERPRHRILHWTHRLRKSLTDANHPEHVADVSPAKLRFGSIVDYAPYHTESRPFLRLPRDFVITDIAQPIQQYVLGRDPRLGQGRRRTRRIFDAPARFFEAAD